MAASIKIHYLQLTDPHHQVNEIIAAPFDFRQILKRLGFVFIYGRELRPFLPQIFHPFYNGSV